MIHSVPNTDRVATPWVLTSRRFDWLGKTAAAVLRAVQRFCGLGNGRPELWMSREWLDEYARQPPKHPDGDI